MSEEKELNLFRDKIDQLDLKILTLLNERATLALDVVKTKIKHQGKDTEIFRPEREKHILNTLKSKNDGLLSNRSIELIFQQVFEACKEIERNYVNLP